MDITFPSLSVCLLAKFYLFDFLIVLPIKVWPSWLVEHLGCHFEVTGSSPAKFLLDYPIHGSGGCGRVTVVHRSGVGLKGAALRGLRFIQKKKEKKNQCLAVLVPFGN